MQGVDGSVICAGVSSQYCMIDYDSGQFTDLFPIDTENTYPIVKRISKVSPPFPSPTHTSIPTQYCVSGYDSGQFLEFFSYWYKEYISYCEKNQSVSWVYQGSYHSPHLHSTLFTDLFPTDIELTYPLVKSFSKVSPLHSSPSVWYPRPRFASSQLDLIDTKNTCPIVKRISKVSSPSPTLSSTHTEYYRRLVHIEIKLFQLGL